MVSGTDAANPRDTFFNGRLYVSNQAKAFNTVLVTHLGPEPAACLDVEVRNNNTGSKITLSLVPSLGTPGTGGQHAALLPELLRGCGPRRHEPGGKRQRDAHL